MQDLRGIRFDIGQASANPAESARHTLQRAMWQVSDDAGEVDAWWARVLGDATALAAHCRERLAAYKTPRHFRFVDASALPLTTTGKLKRNALVGLFTRR